MVNPWPTSHDFCRLLLSSAYVLGSLHANNIDPHLLSANTRVSNRLEQDHPKDLSAMI